MKLHPAVHWVALSLMAVLCALIWLAAFGIIFVAMDDRDEVERKFDERLIENLFQGATQ